MPLATRRDIGQFLIGSLPGTTIPAELRSLAREFDLGGVILFSRNIEAPEQVAELSAESEALGRTMPAWVSVDQEGGRVARLKEPFTQVAADGDARARRQGVRGARRSGSRGRSPRNCWPSASRSITRRSWIFTPTRRTR